MDKRRVVIRCHEDNCVTPVAELRPGQLIIKTRHHNQWHVTVVTFEQLRDWMEDLMQEKRTA